MLRKPPGGGQKFAADYEWVVVHGVLVAQCPPLHGCPNTLLAATATVPLRSIDEYRTGSRHRVEHRVKSVVGDSASVELMVNARRPPLHASHTDGLGQFHRTNKPRL